MNAYLVAGGIAVLVALTGGLSTDTGSWYQNLKKPQWNPPDWLFAPAWTVIYCLIVWSCGLTWNTASAAGQTFWVTASFSINAVLNAAWSILFFALKRPDWALIDAALLWISTGSICTIAWTHSTVAGALLIPYLLWVSFATILNLSIVKLNGYTCQTP